MDQLVTEGPIVAGFMVYNDFYQFGQDKNKCKNDVYTYDGKSRAKGNHAITIAGYGLLNNKFYWLIQNSWGSNWCDEGLIKMEIGQFIKIVFSETLISKSQGTPL